ncbi:hypothetical protein [Dyella sp. 2RAB6]|uniref:hypothetical protein n=1 Tax=Dyella sp. 2RAB6 TaxID=3232992 RepID=UPI003F906C8C
MPGQLRELSGKTTPSAVRRWARTQNIRIKDGANGPWTTLDALNESLGVGVVARRSESYRPDEVI